ncbi:UPF0158 family protein [Arthrobacter sp. FW306-06-A]|uniref:UPF0158 family protein n=1 Tax=Arthrobacter sp. FW306-06-A TaxID=2879621 RepID=UPI001EEF67BB|nr:UPF0158 family protein [Arthrobacter sp. FW306-06-A]UKA73459.1 hypothetical protein LFT49_21920 [Arthrobacter sp. FW306-06-A]
MARTWLSVTVELLGGRGQELWPWPGRIFAVGPSHTFLNLADAINDAFARWDRSHLSLFTLADGRVITDEETGAEMTGSIRGPIIAPTDIAAAKVVRTLEPGAEFQFTFDLGDAWIHRCVVGEVKVDPLEVLGVRPDLPLPYWGWGSIPDQYGRRWATDDRESRAPEKPGQPHPMLLHAWPASVQIPALDLSELREAIAAEDAARFLAAVTGRDIDDALQQVGAGIPMALERSRQEAEPVALSVINRLTWRGGDGDQVLAEDLLAGLRRVPLTGRLVPVDLEMLSMVLEGDPDLSTGGYLDLRTGQVYDETATDPMMVGEDAAIDVEEEPDRWLRLNRAGSRDGWQDMEAFAERQHDAALRERLERAIGGKGAFSRFRDLVYSENLAEQWHTFSTDRQMGRAREFLADNGIRVG